MSVANSTQSELIAIRRTIEDALNAINKTIALLPSTPRPEVKNQGEMIIKEVERYAKTEGVYVFADNRKRNTVFYKSIICYLLTDYCKWTLKDAASRIGYKTHCNVLQHRDQLRYWMSHPQVAPFDIYTKTKEIMLKTGL